MKGWVCPECGRRFGRTNQSHGCAPAMTVDAYFKDRSEADRKIHDAVARYLDGLGEITIDAVNVGILYKRVRTFAELRPKRGGMELGFLLSRAIEDDRITKTLKLSANRTAHFVQLAKARDVDRAVKAWLAEAYASSPA